MAAANQDFLSLVDVQERGKGIFAKQRIAKGTMILVDNILIKIISSAGGPLPNDAAKWEILIKQFHCLSKRQQMYIASQPSNICIHEEEIVDSWSTLDDQEPLTPPQIQALSFCIPRMVRGMFFCERGWQFRHSCSPNVYAVSHTGSVGQMSYRTIRDIEAGEELTASYLHNFDHGLRLDGGREEAKSESWIICSCAACIEGPEKRHHEIIRRDLINGRNSRNYLLNHKNPCLRRDGREEIRKAEQYVKLCEDNPYFVDDAQAAYDYLAAAHHLAYDIPNVLLAYTRSSKYALEVTGPDSQQTCHWIEMRNKASQWLEAVKDLLATPWIIGCSHSPWCESYCFELALGLREAQDGPKVLSQLGFPAFTFDGSSLFVQSYL